MKRKGSGEGMMRMSIPGGTTPLAHLKMHIHMRCLEEK